MAANLVLTPQDMENQRERLIQVVIADDHPKVRLGLHNLLDSTPDIQVVAEASNGFEALSLVDELDPDVLLLDMDMPLLDGPAVAEALRGSGCRTRILAVSAYDDRQYILSLLENGAAGYLMKEEAVETLITAVRGVAQGKEGWVSRRVADRIARWQSAQADPTNPPTFTPRERAVLAGISELQSNAEIARRLGLTESTVARYVELLKCKLHASSRTALAVFAERQRLA